MWWEQLLQDEQTKVAVGVELLRLHGATLGFPWPSGISISRHSHLRELRVQVDGRPFRVLYAFNPLRNATLLLGGDKMGNQRWYEVNVPIADRLYDEHLNELREEGQL